MMSKTEAYLLAGQAGISESALRKFAQSRSPNLRLRVAENRETPPDLLMVLASDGHVEVRAAAGCHETAPDNVLNNLVCDADPTVRYELASNPGTKLWALLLLSDDENPYVQCRAKSTLQRLMN